MGSSIDTGHPLWSTQRPEFELGHPTLRLVDLFAGCGGLTLGVAQAVNEHGWGLNVVLAVDSDPNASAAYERNFPKAIVANKSVDAMFDGGLGTRATTSELELKRELEEIDVLVGGPPCQGHSNLNNHTRRNDPKNALYLRMGRAAEILRPCTVLIENVPTVKRDKNNVVEVARAHLTSLDYQVTDQVIRLEDLGVPQKRRRHIMLATMPGCPHPDEVFRDLKVTDHTLHDLRWAIGDLVNIPARGWFDRIPQANALNIRRMQWLLDKDEYDLPNRLRPKCHQDGHTYKSMYGRLKWTEVAQTLTTGFSSIGQGRYMHPERLSALTAHEAARIQGFPDYFDFMTAPTRNSLKTMIGNAVPPQLGKEIFGSILGHLPT